MAQLRSYTDLKEAIIVKLTALEDAPSDKLFAVVSGTNEADVDGYPAAFVIQTAGEGQVLDTHRNEREWQFSVIIHQAITASKNAEDADAIVLNAVDQVIKSFDEDPQFIDPANDEGRVKLIKAVPIEIFPADDQETAIHRALITVASVALVNRFA